jgi:hypothetical protein
MRSWIIRALAAITLTGSGFAAQPRQNETKTADVQALSYANVVAFFKSAHLRATEVQKRCTIFFEGEWTNANIYNYCVIMVENDDEDIQVTFYLTDAHEMNWVTEFIDSPFFTNSEKQALFGRLNRSEATRGQRIGRFKVDVHQWRPRHAEIIVFSFTSLGKSST